LIGPVRKGLESYGKKTVNSRLLVYKAGGHVDRTEHGRAAFLPNLVDSGSFLWIAFDDVTTCCCDVIVVDPTHARC